VQQSAVTIQYGSSHGTGFVVSNDGYIITNNHVVDDAKTVRVLFPGGAKMEGQVLKRDPQRDVALVKVDSSNTVPLQMRLDEPAIGNDVFAVGSPMDLKWAGTVTKGIVSSFREYKGKRWIQSDTTINPGNSGGPLVDSQGRVVGISTLSFPAVKGMYYFIPIADALQALDIAVQ